MAELRKDPIVGRWVIFSAKRAARPVDFEAEASRPPGKFCPFCQGNEEHTPGEIFAVRDGATQPDTPGWQVRVVPNKYPALEGAGEVDSRSDGLYQWLAGVGAHEVIVESPRHLVSTTQLSTEEVADVLRVYRRRLAELKKDRRLRYGLVFKNVGAAAGASLEHLHSQLIATPIVPINIQEELDGSLRFHQQQQRCVWCAMVEHETRDGSRLVAQTDNFIAFCPFAARFAYETWLMPLRHASHFENSPDHLVIELAALLRGVLESMEQSLAQPSYNYLIHTAPFDTVEIEHYHWHIEVFPRITKTAGFEWGTGYYINPVPPEEAAAVLRGERKGRRFGETGNRPGKYPE